MRKVSRKTRTQTAPPPWKAVSPSTWLLALAIVLAPLTAGRLEVGSEPVEPSLRGVITALFAGGSMLSVAVWLIALLGLAAVGWEWLARTRETDAVPRSARVFATLLLAWLLASVFTSVYRWGTVVAWSWWAVALTVAWLYSRRRGDGVLVVLAAMAVAGTLTGALALREYAENVRDVPNWRVFGTFFNPNFLAGYLCLTMPVTLALALTAPPAPSGSHSRRWLAGFGAYLQMAAILLTGSRFGVFSAVLALAVMAGWMALARAWSRQTLALFGLFCVLTLITAGALARPLTQRVTNPPVQAREHSGGFRVWTWRGTLAMAQANAMLGTGLGTYEIAYPRYAMVGFTRLAHNSYLQLSAEAGAPALILLVGTLGTLAWTVLRRERNAFAVVDGWDARVLRAGLAGAVAAGLARNLIDSDWSIFACLSTFWAVVGVLLALTVSSSPDLSPTRGEGQGVRALLLAHALLLVVALTVLTFRVAGALSANRSGWNLSQGMVDDEGYLRALHWEPWNGDHALSLGTLYLGMARSGDPSRARGAEQYLRRSAQLMPTAKTWYHLGNLYRDVLADPAKAVEAYRRALQLDPHALRVMVELGATLERLGKREEAEQVYRRMLEIEQSVYGQVRAVPELPEVDFAFAHAGLARLTRSSSKPNEVRELYRRALQILDADRSALENNPMAQAMTRTPERERALEELRRECERALQTRG